TSAGVPLGAKIASQATTSKPVAELGVPGFDVVAWDAIFAPKGTPAEVVRKLAEHLDRALQKPDMRKKMQDIGVEPLYMAPAPLGEFVRSERLKWGAVIQAANIRTE
ncbi:MAG: tripartite tricarboxylate transporter substrate binding protein, partial [Comamonadaceae bacterium]